MTKEDELSGILSTSANIPSPQELFTCYVDSYLKKRTSNHALANLEGNSIDSDDMQKTIEHNVQLYEKKTFDVPRDSQFMFLLPSIHCFITVVGNFFYIYSIYNPSKEHVIIKQWNSEQQNDRIITMSAVIAPQSVSGSNKLGHLILVFTARGRLLQYVLVKSCESNREVDIGEMSSANDSVNIVLQQRVQSYGCRYTHGVSLSSDKTITEAKKKPLHDILNNLVVDNPRVRLIDNPAVLNFQKRAFMVPTKDSFLHGCDRVHDVLIQSVNSGKFSKAKEQVSKSLADFLGIGESESNGAKKDSYGHNQTQLQLQKGEYVCKVIQHLPTRSIIFLTKNALTSGEDCSAVSSIYQLILTSGGYGLPSFHICAKAVPIDKSEVSIIETIQECASITLTHVKRFAGAVWSCAKEDTKRRKISTDNIVEKSENDYQAMISFFQPHAFQSFNAVYPPIFTSSSTLHCSNEPLSNNYNTVDIAIDDMHDFLYALKSNNTVEVYEIQNAGWSDVFTEGASYTHLQFHLVKVVDHSKYFRVHCADQVESKLTSINLASEGQKLPGTCEEIRIYNSENIEMLFSVQSSTEVFQYGYFVNLTQQCSEAMQLSVSPTKNVDNFSISLAKIMRMKDQPKAFIPSTKQNMTACLPMVHPHFTTRSCAISQNNTGRMFVTSSAILPVKALGSSRFNISNITHNILSENFFSSRSHGVLRSLNIQSNIHFSQPFYLFISSEYLKWYVDHSLGRDMRVSNKMDISFFLKCIDLLDAVGNREQCAENRLRAEENLHEFNIDVMRRSECIKEIFEFQHRIFCAGLLSTNASVDVSAVEHGLDTDSSKTLSGRSIRTAWSLNMDFDSTKRNVKFPCPSFIKSIYRQALSIIEPIIHLRIFQHSYFAGFPDDTGKNVGRCSTEYYPTLSNDEIETIIENLTELRCTARLLLAEHEHKLNSRSATIKYIGTEFIECHFAQLTNISQVNRGDITDMTLLAIKHISDYVDFIVQALRLIQVIYSYVNTYYSVTQRFNKSCTQDNRITVSFLSFWDTYNTSSFVMSKCTGGKANSVNKASNCLENLKFGSLLFVNTEEFNEIFSTKLSTRSSKTFFMSFIRAVFLFVASETVLTASALGDAIIITKPDSFIPLKDLSARLEEISNMCSALFTLGEAYETSILTNLAALTRESLNCIHIPSTGTIKWIEELESSLINIFENMFESSVLITRQALIGIVNQCIINAQIAEMLENHDANSLKYQSRVNYLNICASTVYANKSYVRQEFQYKNEDVLWFYLTQYQVRDIEKQTKTILIKKLQTVTTNTETISNEPLSAICSEEISFAEFLYPALSKLNITQATTRSTGTKNIVLSAQLRESLRNLFGLQDMDLLQNDCNFPNRLFQWVAFDALKLCESKCNHNQLFFTSLCQYREKAFMAIFEGISTRSTHVQRILLGACEMFLTEQKKTLCETFVDFYLFFANTGNVIASTKYLVEVLLGAAKRPIRMSASREKLYAQFIERYSPCRLNSISDTSYENTLDEISKDSLFITTRLSLLQKAERISPKLAHHGNDYHLDIRGFASITRIQLQLFECIRRRLYDKNASNDYIEWQAKSYSQVEFFIDAMFLLSHVSVFSADTSLRSLSSTKIEFAQETEDTSIINILYRLAGTCLGYGGEIIQLHILAEFYPFDVRVTKFNISVRKIFDTQKLLDEEVAALVHLHLNSSVPCSKHDEKHEFERIIPRAEALLHDFHSSKIGNQLCIHVLATLELCKHNPVEYDEFLVSRVPLRLMGYATSQGPFAGDLLPMHLFDFYHKLLNSVSGNEDRDDMQSVEAVSQRKLRAVLPLNIFFAMSSTLFIWWEKSVKSGIILPKETIGSRLSLCTLLLKDLNKGKLMGSSLIQESVDAMIRKIG